MSYYQANAASPPPTADEGGRVPEIAEEAYGWLWKQEGKCAELADLISELREYDLRSVLIDAVLSFMSDNNWVVIWRRRGEGGYWISVVEGNGDGDDDDDDDGDEGEDEEEGS